MTIWQIALWIRGCDYLTTLQTAVSPIHSNNIDWKKNPQFHYEKVKNVNLHSSGHKQGAQYQNMERAGFLFNVAESH